MIYYFCCVYIIYSVTQNPNKMKKIIVVLVVALFTIGVNAQETKQEPKEAAKKESCCSKKKDKKCADSESKEKCTADAKAKCEKKSKSCCAKKA